MCDTLLAPARTPLTPAHWAIIFTASLGGFLEVLDKHWYRPGEDGWPEVDTAGA